MRNYPLVTNHPFTIDPPQTNFVSLATIQKRQVAHLQNFAVIVARLEALTAKELAGESLDTDDKSFINRLMEEGPPAAFPQSSSSVSIGLQGFSSVPVPSANPLAKETVRLLSGGPMAFTGWYPGLFYRTIYWQNDDDFHGLYGAEAAD